MLTVVCVYKTGGAYSADYVLRLEKAVYEHITISHRFICLTDSISVDCCEVTPLAHDWPGWWSKIELFRPDLNLGPCVYFDLDTMIVGNIDKLLEYAGGTPFAMLRGFSKYNAANNIPASGVMIGNFALHDEVYYAFGEKPEKYMKMHKLGDQIYIANQIKENIPRLQDVLPKDYIVGKRIAKERGFSLPKTKVIAWSGQPRLHKAEEEYIVNYWYN